VQGPGAKAEGELAELPEADKRSEVAAVEAGRFVVRLKQAVDHFPYRLAEEIVAGSAEVRVMVDIILILFINIIFNHRWCRE
jgi:hypothetical protein